MHRIPKKRNQEDPLLPGLERAIHGKTVAEAMAAFFSREYPEQKIQILKCRVRQIYHKPGKSCRITYQVACKSGENDLSELWLHGLMLARKSKLNKLVDKAPEQWPGCGFWKPVLLWPEFSMVLHTFPYDPEMPYLGQLLDPAWVSAVITRQYSADDPLPKWKCRSVNSRVMKYRFGKSCLLRYQVDLENDAGRHRTLRFYGKTYNSDQSRYVYEALREICQAPACQRGELNIPAPIAHIDTANTLWQEEWPGENVTTLAKKTDWAVFHTPDFMNKVAVMLAALHQIELREVQLKAGPEPRQVLANVDKDIAKILPFVPERAERLAEIKTAMQQFAAQWSDNIPRTTIHGTFKLSQILVRNGQLGLVDFDALALGDPLYDAAELISSVAYLQFSDGLPAETIRSQIEIFLQAYETRSSFSCDRTRLAFYIIAFLLGKIHSSLKKAESAAAESLTHAFQLIEEWQTSLT